VAVDLVVRRGELVTAEGVRRGDLAVDSGVIVAIEDEFGGRARRELDALGLLLFPGLIDIHVHFNEPGRDWEGFASGSAALAAGGGTTFADMPLNSDPPLLDAKAFEAKRAAGEAASVTDFALWGALTPDSLERLPELAACGAIGFKAFMSASGIPEYRTADDLTLFEGMRLAAELGLPVAVHAESDALTAALTERFRRQGRRGARDYLASRPVIAELEAIQRALLFAEETGCQLHIVHVSTARGVALVEEAKARGVKVSCETCPHYLLFTDDDLERLGAVLKCAPPLRDEATRDALVASLRAGRIDLVASDHSPASGDLKGGDDFFAIWGGVAGVQSTLNALLELKLPPPLIARLCAQAPAARFGFKGKGVLHVGHDADLTLVDLNATTTLDEASLLTRHKLSPYLGLTLRGRVRRTLVRGETVCEDGRIVRQGGGRLVTPQAEGSSLTATSSQRG
jgi:allantoinase